ncbi:sensor histidine kinase [Nonomuraea sp. NPDC052265]|uniref:sensor histidine kinase n=1 Tax=Nonomuraea sp. NPDC052265 TaxID=3364374 RepID=UPI0037CC75D1
MTGIMDKAKPALAGELESVCGRWSERTGVAVEIWALPAGPVTAALRRAVLAVVDEALDNVEAHSGASTTSLAVTCGAHGLRLTISDNGRGFTSTAPGGGTGRMRTAFAELGGRLSVRGVPGEGTTVSGTVPA